MNTLNAELHTSVTPALLNNIQIMNLSSDAAVTLGLINANQVQEVNNVSSSAVLTVNNIVTTADLGVQDLFEVSGGVTPDAIFSFRPGYTGPIDLAVQNVGIDQNSVEVEINASSTYQSIATVNLQSLGEQESYVTLLRDTTAPTANITTVNVTGDNDLDLVAGDATLVNASTFTGGLTFALGAVAGGTINGGSGIDYLTGNAAANLITTGDGIANSVFVSSGGADTVLGGAGNDFVATDTATLAGFASIDGGLGTNTLRATYATTVAVGALTNINNFQTLYLTGATAGAINVSNIDSTITTILLDTGAAGSTLTVNDAATTIALVTNASSTGSLTINDAAASTTNSVTIANGTSAGNAFGGQAITAAGIETLTLNTGSTATAQTISTLTIDGEAVTTPVSVSVSGGNAINFTAGLASSATALLSVDLSGLTAQATGVTSAITGIVTDGNVSIIGSAGNDGITGDATGSNTIVGNAGADSLAGGAVADSLTGGAGNDFLYGGGGNDTMLGGDDNDFITAATVGGAFNPGTVSIDAGAGNDTVLVGNTLTSGDTVNGGEGRDTLAVTGEIIASYAGATNFEIFRVDAPDVNQNLALYTGTTFDKVVFNATTGTKEDTVTGAAATVTDVLVLTGQTLANFQHTNAANNAVTFGGYTDVATTVTGITAVNEETIVIGDGNITAAGGGDFTITTLTGGDLTTLIFDGETDKVISSAIVNANADYTLLTTVNASSNTGTVSVSVANATVGVAMTGSATAASSLTGGTGNDTITGGAVADSLVGGAGNDVINGGGGSDSITGGAGSDLINIGEGTADVIYYTDNTDTQTGVVATGFTYTGDIITGMANGDQVDLHSLGNLSLVDGAISVGTTFATATPNLVVIVSGSYDTLTGIFTAGAASAINNDYLLQYNGGTTTTTVNETLLVDIVGTVTAASVSEVISFTVA